MPRTGLADEDLYNHPGRNIWAEGGVYSDPTVHLVGRSALAVHIGDVQSRYPGSRVARTTSLDRHHRYGRFGWKRTLSDGTALPEGIDFVDVAGDGRLARVVGFFGPLA